MIGIAHRSIMTCSITRQGVGGQTQHIGFESVRSNLVSLGILPRHDIYLNTFSYFLVSFPCRFVEAFCTEIKTYFPDEWSNEKKVD